MSPPRPHERLLDEENGLGRLRMQLAGSSGYSFLLTGCASSRPPGTTILTVGRIRIHPDPANGRIRTRPMAKMIAAIARSGRIPGLNQQRNPATQDSSQLAGTDESGRDQRTDLAALHEIAETFMAPVREQLADLKLQLVAERDRADRERDRADFAEVRAREAETRVKEVLDQLQTEMVEHRRVVGMLAKQLSARQSWWPWRRR